MIRIAAMLLVPTLWVTSSTQTINLKGTISSTKGKAIAGAKVTLSKKKLTVTTDSKGAYSIISETSVLMPDAVSSKTDMISLRKSSIIVDLVKPAAVKIEMFDMKGNLLRKIVDQPSSAGSFRFEMGVQPINSAMTVVRVTAGSAFSTFRYIPLKNDFQLATTSSMITLTGEKLSKVAVVVDTLQVSASGYMTKTVTVSSYETTQNITLDTNGLANFSFFVTSLKAIQDLSKSENGFGGDLRFGKTGQGAGLLGADSICQCIAERSMKGSGVKQWRAFLSVSKGPDGTQVNAIDRVGNGPWYDRLGRTVALTKSDLANQRPKNCDDDIIDDLPNEDGIPNHRPDPSKPQVDDHLTITGSDTKGKLYASNATCSDWTSKAAGGSEPRAGLSWPRGGGFGFAPPSSLEKTTFSMDQSNWISSWSLPGCEAGICLVEKGGPLPGETFIGSGGGYGGFYCFALNP
jgi:hypothetical protein